jgi:hypothetical protein
MHYPDQRRATQRGVGVFSSPLFFFIIGIEMK